MAENNNKDAESAFSSNSRDASSPTGVYVKWVLLILVVGALIGFFMIKPGLEGFFGNNAETSNQLATNISNQQLKADLMAQAKNLDATKGDVNKFLESFPQDAQQQKMVDELQDIARRNGVSITGLTPGTPSVIGADGKAVAPTPVTAAADGSTPTAKAAAPAGTLLGTIDLKIALSGNNINGFITDLEKSKRVFIITKLTYNDDGNGTKTATLDTSTYIVSPITEPQPPNLAG